MSYNTLKVFVLGFLLVYFAGGLFTRRFPKEEVYPFFSWSLFDRMPNSHITYTIRVHRYSQERFNPPKFFADAAYMFSGTDNSPSRYDVIIQDLGESLERKDADEILTNRKRLEVHMNDDVEYEVIKVTYNPLKFWKDREVTEMVHLGFFSRGEM